MPLSTSERLVRRYLMQCGFEVEKIPEDGRQRTPDFRASRGPWQFVVEVKSITCHEVPTSVVSRSGVYVPNLLELRDDNGPSRICRKIVDAADQLQGSDVPKILALVNYEDTMSFREDFLPGYRGYDLLGWASDGAPEVSWIAPAKLFNELRAVRNSIDLYLWIEATCPEGERTIWFGSTSRIGWRIGQHFFKDRLSLRRAERTRPTRPFQ